MPLKSPLDGNDLMRLFDRGPGPWLRPLKDYLLGLVLDNQLAPDDTVTAEAAARAFMAAQEGEESEREPAKGVHAGGRNGAAAATREQGETPVTDGASTPAVPSAAHTAKRRQSKHVLAPPEMRGEQVDMRGQSAPGRPESHGAAPQEKGEVQP